MNDLLSLSDLTRDEFEWLLSEGDRYADLIRKGEGSSAVLQGRTVTTAFFEASTRTRISFTKAARELGAEVLNLDPDFSSVSKGESLKDTLLTIEAIGTDILVVRHVDDDVPQRAAGWIDAPVVNVGAGRVEHPTQTLLDMLTMKRHFGRIEPLTIGLVGDIANSRVAAGHIATLPRLGAGVVPIGPEEFLPLEPRDGIRVITELDPHLGDLDVLYMLRVQSERGPEPGADYRTRYRLDAERLRAMKDSAVVMHPGPLNRGVEIADEVADGERSLILEQVRNGVPMRMAVLAAVSQGLT